MEHIRILIVEDERIIASDIRETLVSFGYSVVGITDNGEQAIIKASELKPDIIIMDIMLKGKMSGIEAAAKIKDKMDVPIIYLTSYADSDSIEKAKITEPFGYILKPFSEKELHTTIEMAIYKYNSEKKIRDSERKYRSLYDNAPDGLVSTNRDWIIFENNRKFSDMVDISSKELDGTSLLDLMKPESADDFRKILPKFEQKGFILNFEAVLAKKNSVQMPVLINSTILRDEQKNYIKTQTSIRDITALKSLEVENTILSEKIVRLSRKIPLTENEKRVFAGMVCEPLLNDVELSKKLQIKRSTVTSIKNKLLREKYFSVNRMPNFAVLGLELLAVFHADISQVSLNKDKKDELLKQLSKSEEIFYFNATDKMLTCFAAVRNLTELKIKVLSVFEEFEKYGILENKEIFYFYLQFAAIENFFDFSRLICYLFELEQPKNTFKAAKSRKMTEKEKLVFYNLVRHSSLNDSEIAQESKIPRPSISQTRKKLTSQGILLTSNIPNFVQIRCELLSYNYLHLEGDIAGEMQKKLINHIRSMPSTVFFIHQGREFYYISLFNDYSESEDVNSLIQKFLADNKMVTRMQTSKLIPITSLRTSKLNFHNLIKDALNIRQK